MSKAGKTRVAIYARISTAKQKEASVDEQIHICREYAKKKGWRVSQDLIFSDVFISGFNKHRPGLQTMMRRIAEWDVLLCLDFDRLARNTEIDGWVRNRLEANQKQGFQAKDGKDFFSFDAKIAATMNAEYRRKIGEHTQVGLTRQVRNGYAGNKPPVGYALQSVRNGEPCLRGDDGRTGSVIVVVEEHAALIRRIYQLYLEGAGAKAIAVRLNKEGTIAPHNADGWTYSGVRKILRNPMYTGKYFWNKEKHVKDPDTKVVKRFARPESEWISATCPQIIDQKTWKAAQHLATRRDRVWKAGGGRAGPRRALLSGFLECTCGGSIYVQSRGRLSCGKRRERGDKWCAVSQRISQAEIEARVLKALEEQVLVTDVILAIAEKAANMVRSAADTARDAARVETLTRRLANLVENLADTGSKQVALKIRETEADLAEVTARAAAAKPFDRARVAKMVEAEVGRLSKHLRGNPAQARQALQALLAGGRLAVIWDDTAPGGYRVEGTAAFPVDLGCDYVPVGTARHAAEQNREVAVVPGPVDTDHCRGSNRLLCDGAIPILEAEELIVRVLGDAARMSGSRPAALSVSGDAGRVLARLRDAAQDPDQLSRQLAIPPARMASILLGLELEGLVTRDGTRIALCPGQDARPAE